MRPLEIRESRGVLLRPRREEDCILPPESAAQARARFHSETTARFTERCSAASAVFERAKPAEGFDRLTANRTNYQVRLPGVGTEREWSSQTHTLFADPAERSTRAVPAAVLADSRPRRDLPRDFDIVTGAPRDPATAYHRHGPRRTGDVPEASITSTHFADPTTGVIRPRAKAPPPPVSGHGRAAERAVAVPPLGTLATVRPPTPTGTSYYTAFQR